MTQPMYVRGLSVWTRATTDTPAWLAPYAHAADALPNASLLPVRARARASLLTRMFAEVIELATIEDVTLRQSVPMIFGSCYGEMVITGALLQMMNEDKGAVSPARFQMSVHNGAAGQLSIACANQAFSTCLAAGRNTVAACMEEAQSLLNTRGGEVIVALADETTSTFFETRGQLLPLAFAARLGATGDSSCPTISLSDVADGHVTEPDLTNESPLALGLPVWRALIEERSSLTCLTTRDAWPCFAQIKPGIRT